MKYNEMYRRFEARSKADRVQVCFKYETTPHCCTSGQLGSVYISPNCKIPEKYIKEGTAELIRVKREVFNGWDVGLLHVELVTERQVNAFKKAGWKVVTEYWSPGHNRKVTQLQYINPKFDKYKRNPGSRKRK